MQPQTILIAPYLYPVGHPDRIGPSNYHFEHAQKPIRQFSPRRAWTPRKSFVAEKQTTNPQQQPHSCQVHTSQSAPGSI